MHGRSGRLLYCYADPLGNTLPPPSFTNSVLAPPLLVYLEYVSSETTSYGKSAVINFGKFEGSGLEVGAHTYLLLASYDATTDLR